MFMVFIFFKMDVVIEFRVIIFCVFFLSFVFIFRAEFSVIIYFLDKEIEICRDCGL